MATRKHLNNAPITEALVDIRVVQQSHENIAFLDAMQGLISEQYPDRRERVKIEAKIDVKANEFRTSKRMLDGFIYTSEDKKQVIQVRLDGFTFSRLKPYQTWENLRDEAKRLWRLYVETSSPQGITRIALRYINRIEIPLPVTRFSDYLTAPPIVPEALPQALSGFLTRLAFMNDSYNAETLVSQKLERPNETSVPVILDIDVFSKVDYNINDEGTWEHFDRLRDFKNEIFFESVTDQALRLYE